MMMRNVVVLWLATMVLVEGEVSKWLKPPPKPSRYFVHVVNGLSYQSLDVHCQSKNDDLGYHHLVNRGDEYQWNFEENLWGTTLFWCRLEKPDAYVAFESFWPETKNVWLRDRCGNQGTCIWTAKDDGIYLRNMPTNVDEFVHKWIPK
ncbi:pumilio-like protein 15-like [Cucumis melo var. makuwa]|uniref:S-protein homolog n=2 Tax=Cucumis melo TaxID=3656 RepID=A0A5A7UAS6_CUCMM|nr:pumilio-like protein 15-like [Cucumis melo var. makuwa]TYK07770.1 pumilio-like protein 15-like [Cucumis melo var. makuwa]